MRTERANAKINLYLDVRSKRENGYHNIVSIMQTVSLCDLVSVEFMPSGHTSVSLRASGNSDMPLDCRNLAWRAAEVFLKRTERSGEVRIMIEKHIPMAAGLAGGSADAAAVLRALNRLCGTPLSMQQLCDLGATLGADVPFCIVGGSAMVTGIGEKLEEYTLMPSCHLVVARMGEGISTPWAYGELDRLYHHFSIEMPPDVRPERIEHAMKSGDLKGACVDFYNIFEDVVPSVQPYVEALRSAMREAGAIRAMMSGSGPSVFGVFENVENATAAVDALRHMGAVAFVCHPCGKYRV